MRVLLVDDEALARLRLRSLLQELPDLAIETIGEAGNADEALQRVRAAPAAAPWDVLLLDIRMPGTVAPGRQSQHVGLRLADALRSVPRPPVVVFVSAHAEYALAAFDLEAVDYLTKPVRRERLHAALLRARQRLQQQGRLPVALPVAAPPAEAEPAPAPAQPVLVFSERGRVLRVPVAEVLYFKAEQKYVTLRTASHSYLLDEPLSDLETRLVALGGPPFIRVHRNALVALHAVRALELRDARDVREGREGRDSRDGREGREGPGSAGDEASETWAVRVAPLDEWLAVSRRQVAAVRAALASGA